MNTPNNRRRKESQEKIEKAFIEEIQFKELDQVTVSDIVKKANINRSTFYANYLDIYDLADKIREEMFYNVLDLYKEEAESRTHSYNFLKLFEHIKDNQIYYKTLFKLNFDFSKYYDLSLTKDEAIKFLGSAKNIDYHIAFFSAGLGAVIKKWLYNGCIESPEEINNVLINEYTENKRF